MLRAKLPHAVAQVPLAFAQLGDERVLDHDGGYTVVARPPTAGWVSLLGRDVTGRAVLFRRAALRAIGGYDAAAGSGVRHDAVIRLVESGARGGAVAVRPGQGEGAGSSDRQP